MLFFSIYICGAYPGAYPYYASRSLRSKGGAYPGAYPYKINICFPHIYIYIYICGAYPGAYPPKNNNKNAKCYTGAGGLSREQYIYGSFPKFRVKLFV